MCFCCFTLTDYTLQNVDVVDEEDLQDAVEDVELLVDEDFHEEVEEVVQGVAAEVVVGVSVEVVAEDLAEDLTVDVDVAEGQDLVDAEEVVVAEAFEDHDRVPSSLREILLFFGSLLEALQGSQKYTLLHYIPRMFVQNICLYRNKDGRLQPSVLSLS